MHKRTYNIVSNPILFFNQTYEFQSHFIFSYLIDLILVYRFAINVMGFRTLPYHWIEKPYYITCGGASISSSNGGKNIRVLGRNLLVGGLMFYLRYSCLFGYRCVQHILCCVFALLFFVLCTICFQFLWIDNF